MADLAKFKLNLKTREVEIEGSEAFVERQIRSLETIFETLSQNDCDSRHADEDESVEKVANIKSGDKPMTDSMPATFGEWMHSFKTELTDLDKALITAKYVQLKSPENDFKTAEVNTALKEHGIKLSNPSGTLKRLAGKKYLFQTRKVGKLRFMRLSTDGQEILESLKAKQN